MNYRHLIDIRKWLRAYEEAGVGPTSLYNKLMYIKRAQMYTFVKQIFEKLPDNVGCQTNFVNMAVETRDIKERHSEQGAIAGVTP